MSDPLVWGHGHALPQAKDQRLCTHCNQSIVIICDTVVHKDSRSTRCSSWKVCFPALTVTAPPPKAFLVEKPSWIERLLRKLR